MAARIRKIAMTKEWKEKIKISQIINRLVDHFDGAVELSKTQIDVAKILLAKVAPDLTKATLSGDADNPLIISEIRRTIIDSRPTDTQSA